MPLALRSVLYIFFAFYRLILLVKVSGPSLVVSILKLLKRNISDSNNGFCWHCTDFFPKTKIRSHFLRLLGGVGSKWGSRWGQGVGEPLGEPPPTPSRPPFGPHDPHKTEKIRSHLWFWENPYNVNTNLSLSKANFGEIQSLWPFIGQPRSFITFKINSIQLFFLT